ncbi:NitT/TauT family transport system ATP-binding protein [Bacillus mesophilus]|uniref:ABC transporter ATP-binding protein n=1 Tax=Bacillus mesophilus TaxID=1808955 RepID=A0A6M0QAA7_9BACI|nr:ABC transporter ATP-binding protein [Bacillus mesophilus]MBM7660450.1 NitT/TauT family transport system ATP-binding protein [Bacillus mesophilus]NEY71998.1 ABC transporter ATP-binding protein [Bacillus mesophilus]
MSFLTIKDIHHTYFTKETTTTALENISLSIEEGEFVSFLGPSGCGKTTLLSIIAGLLKPTEGEINIDGRRVTKPNASIGYMLQQDYLFPWKTIQENILLGPTITNSLTRDTRDYGIQLLKEMDLVNVEDSYPRQLSGGMRQRVALIRTLMTDPKILLLDEPFSALDYQTKLKLENLVSTTLKNFNKTALLVTHDIGEAIAMSDRIFLLAANPGRMAKTFLVPQELRELKPFDARQHTTYSKLFQAIWKELESLEN